MLRIIENTKIWFALSLCIIVISFGMFLYKGINFGIDFKGGSLIQIDMGKDFNKSEVDEIIKKHAPDYQSNKVNVKELEIRSNTLTDESASTMFKEIKDKYKLADKALLSNERIGPSVGSELRQKAIISLTVAIVAMLIFIGFRFELKFGAAAVIALVHDVLITLCVYIIFNIPINLSFIAAMLTVIGYSMNDTIVIFDRIRENLRNKRTVPLNEVVNLSITQTIKRSIYTVTTTLIMTTCVYIYVPSVREFALPLIIGIASGAYSSIFIASPFWVIFKNKGRKVATNQ